MIIRCIIVDDEEQSRKNLQTLIKDFCQGVEVAALCETVDQAAEAIRRKEGDLVFLDVQMQRETGFDLFPKVKDLEFDVVFTTAYAEFAIRAFKFSAVDYLLKPIDVGELNDAIDKVRQRRAKGKSVISDQIQMLMQHLQTSAQPLKVALPVTNGLVFVDASEIIYGESSGNYTIIHTKDGRKFTISRTLKDYEDLLRHHHFFRIHHSFLINLKEVKSYTRGEGGTVTLSNGVSLDVSKRKKEAFLERWSK